MMRIQFKAIGIIHSPFSELEQMPIQPPGKTSAYGTIEVFDEFAGGLKDLDGFSHLILVYFFHRASKAKLLITPFLDEIEHGIFATRAPVRPNPIGLSVVALESVSGSTLKVGSLDVLDGTPLLDIKPYVPQFDSCESVRIGWLEGKASRVLQTTSDSRFK